MLTNQSYQKKTPSVKLGIGQDIALHGSPTVNFLFFLLSPILMKLKGTRDVTSRSEFLLMQDFMVCAWFKKEEEKNIMKAYQQTIWLALGPRG